MPIHLREYHRLPDPISVANLLRRAETQTAPINCGPRIPRDRYAEAEAVVDLSALHLDSIVTQDDWVRIGGQATLQTLIDAPPLQSLASGILPQAAQLAAHFGLRHLATMGGALLTLDGPPEIGLVLLALEANVVTQSAARYVTPLIGYQAHQDDLVVEVTLKHSPANCQGALVRVARTPRDQAIVAAVAVVGPDFARVAVAGASLHPIVKSVTGSSLSMSHLVESVVAEARPIGDYRGSAEYRRAMAGVLSKRALDAARGAG